MVTFLPMSMLMAFALELYFKAWLIQSGYADNTLHTHNIQWLFSQATNNRLPEIQSLAELVDHFAGPHRDFSYRYLREDEVLQNTNWHTAFSIVEKLDDEVDRFVGATAKHRRTTAN